MHPSEEALLAIALRSANYVDRMVEDRIRFTGTAAVIFDQMQAVGTQGRRLDFPTLRTALRNDAEALSLLAQIRELDIPRDHYAQHRDALRDEAIRWQVDVLANRYGALNAPFEGSTPMDVLERLEGDVRDLVETATLGRTTHIHTGEQMVKATFEEMEQRESQGIATGIRALDATLEGGFRPSQLVVIAARPGVGKSAIMCEIADNMVHRSPAVPVLIVSIEMTIGEVTTRMVSLRSRAPYSCLKSKEAMKQLPAALQPSVQRAFLGIKEAPIFCNDCAEVTAPYLRAVIRRYVKAHGVKVVFIDYLQLMKTESRESRVTELDELSRCLKVIAKEENIVIVALAQLNRESERRGGKPKISDLRESGGIEANANTVLLLSAENRPDEGVPEGESDGDVPVILDVAKNRGGPKREIKLNFRGKTMSFHHRDV